ncbi:MAG: AraC family transcriptional regulator [Chthoniobacteraceae bacterium]
MPAVPRRTLPDQRISGTEIGLPLVKAVGSIRSRSAQRIAWHTHEGFELIFLLEGATAYEFQNAGVLELSGGQFLLVPSNTRHRGKQDVRMPSVLCGILFQPERKHAYENSPFTTADLARMNRRLGERPPSVRTMNRELRQLVVRLAEAVSAFHQDRSPPDSKPQLRSMICLAILEAMQLLASRERVGATELVAAARNFLRRHHGDTIRMDDLASHLGLSRARMFEVFRNETGLSPNDYLQRHRIEQAKTLISGSAKSITEIAMTCGFDSSQYFSRVFRKYCGTTPRTHREEKLATIPRRSTPVPRRR